MRLSRDWKVWAFLGSAVVFVATEILAAVQRRGQTATARVRALPKPLRWAVGLAALGLGIWLGPHFALGWWG